jgi:uncharacterized glyoxalase superfamily protein PhnB
MDQKPGSVKSKGGVIACLMLDGANKAADFYMKAFGAEDAYRIPPDDSGRTMHCHLVINGNSVMLSDPYPEHGYPLAAPQAFVLHLQVDDIDAWWNRAIAAGATPTLPIHDAFWGDRYAQLKDPFGVTWALGMTPK